MAMAKIWRNRIMAKDRKYSACPAGYKEAVKALLRQDVADGAITEADYRQHTGEKYVEAK